MKWMTLLRWLALILLATLTAGLALSWAPDRSVDSLKERWAPAPSQFIDLQGMQVHLRDEGPRDDPEPIVLIHGTSASLHTWDGWAKALQGQRRVIRMDLPGFGLTGPAPDGDYRMTRYADFIAALLDQLGVRRAVLAGNSLGGGVAWRTAVQHPERVSRLVLVDASGYPLQSTSVPLGFRLAQIEWLKPVMGKLLPRRMIESSVRNVYANPDKVTPELVDRYYELTLRAGNRESLTQRMKLRETDAQAAGLIPTIGQPTLILWGTEDRLIPEPSGQRFHKEIAGSQYVVLDGLGHVPQEEDPQRSVAEVLKFLVTQR
ncbi:alpha/beta fold hydrolase [Limnohabitans radicicola]|uniref:Alpha/beta hydrolase n=1 Tax=Limnohabitans radicicola TaxID=2771427 RepID=A0A927FL22_9BURK|nr:alpha/beta hydrolase [Limnohabitans radicicola]MBD8051475.1 alpha/beta hydrolase [Limnohabitans radicicola]